MGRPQNSRKSLIRRCDPSVPAVGNRPDSARKLSDLNLVDVGKWKLLNHDESKADLSRKDGVYTVRLKEHTRDYYPNFLTIPMQDIPAEFRPSVPGVSYELSFEAKWEVDKVCLFVINKLTKRVLSTYRDR